MRPLSRLLAATVTAAAVLAGGLVAAPAAWAASAVTVAGPDGTATVSSEYATEVTVSGTGFQSIVNGFGGVYVLFGWVDDPSGGSWRPSRGGEVGADYRYVPDAESADNAGYQRFLAFPGGQTESSAQGVIDADGSWSVGMVVPGARFESTDREGRVTTVDCLRVTCGILTIGAHGVRNANNETFTPLTFRTSGAVDAAGAGAAAESGSGAAASVPARVGIESASVVAGTSIVFTGQGFVPGEQVVAALDGGLSAVGPLTAGAQGEVAAALPVPRDIRDGTHLVTLRGAGSGAVAEAEVAITGGVPELAAAGATQQAPAWALVLMLVCIAIAAVLVVASVVTAIVRARTRRRIRRARPNVTEPAVSPAAGPAPDDLTAALPRVDGVVGTPR
jgi:hypothetical protein